MVDRYLQQDGKTLKNKLGIVRDPERLARTEAVHVNSRIMELHVTGLPQATGFERVKAVHRHLFQDVYDWAGHPRETNLARSVFADGDELVRFTAPSRIETEGRRLFEDLAAANELRGLIREQFAKELATFFTRLNQLHPFRDGNGRTQRILWEDLAKRAGHDLSFEGISRERMVKVSIAASAGYLDPVQRMLRELLDPIRSAALRTATRFLEAHRTEVDWQDRYVATTEPGQSYAGTFVSAGGPNFMMHDGHNILIGSLADLPLDHRNLRGGERVTFRAGDPSGRERKEQVGNMENERQGPSNQEQDKPGKGRDRDRGGFER
jgi:cell filamentation protein